MDSPLRPVWLLSSLMLATSVGEARFLTPPAPTLLQQKGFELEEVLRVGSPDSLAVEDPYAFFGVTDAVLGDEGLLYVLDAGNGRIQVFDQGGSYVQTLGFGVGRTPGRFRRPTSIAWIGKDTLGVLDAGSLSITLIDVSSRELTRVPLPRNIVIAWSMTGLPDGGVALSAFSRSDSTRLHLLSRRLVRTKSLLRWPEGRPLAMLPNYGGARLQVAHDSTIFFAAANPGRLTGITIEGIVLFEQDLAELAPPIDSAVLFPGPAGTVSVRARRASAITGFAVLNPRLYMISLSVADELGSRIALIDRDHGVVSTSAVPDRVVVLGCAGSGQVVMLQDVSGEYVVVYRVVTDQDVCTRI